MSVDGILFDLDGTVADTATAERKSWPALAAVIEAHAPSVERAELEARYRAAFDRHWVAYVDGGVDFVGYRWNRLREALEPWHELDEKLFEAYRVEKRRAVEYLRPFDDALPTVRSLRRTVPVGLLTNGPSRLQRRKLEVTGLDNEFDAVAISEEIGVAKPEAEAFHVAARMIDREPGRVAMVGDSRAYDIDGAANAGLAKAILIRRDDARAAGGTPTVGRLADVPRVLGIAD